jgi:hypothetical protein
MMNSAGDALPTQPPSIEGEELVKCFAQEPAKQAARYDDLAKELVKLALAVPGLYLAVLKFGGDQKLTLAAAGIALNAFAFACWIAAGFAALRALIPRTHRVMQDVPHRVDPRANSDRLTIAEFYHDSAAFKARWLKGSAALF